MVLLGGGGWGYRGSRTEEFLVVWGGGGTLNGVVTVGAKAASLCRGREGGAGGGGGDREPAMPSGTQNRGT